MGAAPPSRILHDLYQGGDDIKDDWIVSHGITHVVSVCLEPPKFPAAIKHSHIPVHDLSDVKIGTYFPDAIRFVHAARLDGGVVYIHCQAGRSRSSTITLSYLMAHLDIPFTPALKLLEAARDVFPNPGFRQQLREFEQARAAHTTALRAMETGAVETVIAENAAESEAEMRRLSAATPGVLRRRDMHTLLQGVAYAATLRKMAYEEREKAAPREWNEVVVLEPGGEEEDDNALHSKILALGVVADPVPGKRKLKVSSDDSAAEGEAPKPARPRKQAVWQKNIKKTPVQESHASSLVVAAVARDKQLAEAAKSAGEADVETE